MNRIERIIYNAVKNNVTLKTFIKRIYQSIFIIVRSKRLNIKFEIVVSDGYFFGFHDKSPWNISDNKILAHKIINNVVGLPKKNDKVEIGYFNDDKLTRFHKVGNTTSWNWQQGAMLQWIGKEDKIIFNSWCKKSDRNVAKIVDIYGLTEKTLPFAIGAVSPNGRFIVSYDFERLNIGMKGYGYSNESKSVSNLDKNIPEELGYSIFDIKEDRVICFKSIFEINEKLYDVKFGNGYVFVTHFQFSPNNNRLFFLLRSYTKGKRLNSRLLSCNIFGDDIFVFPTGKMVSHLTWVGSNKVLAYCTDKNEIEGYYLFEDLNNNYQKIGSHDYTSDGHPQYHAFNNAFLTDTYPNRSRLSELSIYSLTDNKKHVIGTFFSPMRFREEYRCDLHPRWNRSGDKLCIDTTFTGKRSLAVINLNKKSEWN